MRCSDCFVLAIIVVLGGCSDGAPGMEVCSAGEVRGCLRSNSLGTCSGLETCDASGEWGECNAPEAAAEACDGLDNDCDGAVDEDPAPPVAPCELANTHGTCAGNWSCGGSLGWQCDAPTPEAEVCDGLDNDCDGAVDDDPALPPSDCAQTNTYGTCTGTWSCEGSSGWQCDAPTPEAEVCDGLDNDCSGLIDDNPVLPAIACEQTNTFGICAGAWTCVGAAGWSCDAATPLAEACDGLDNDCDGEVDEEFRLTSTGPYVHDDHCGACNAPCGNAVPNSAVETCVDNGGAPRCEAAACAPGFVLLAPLLCLEPVETLCQPCVTDSDCSTPGDLCLSVDGEQVCGYDCSATNLRGTPPGECPIEYMCQTFGLDEQCVPINNSCSCMAGDDGSTRACSQANAYGTCPGVETCVAALGWDFCSAAVPAPESCDGTDEDCDGEVDEDVIPPSTTCEVINSYGTCSGTWSCLGAFGWTCDATTPAEECCDYVDNNCNGDTDEDFKDSATGLYLQNEHCGDCNHQCIGEVWNATATDCVLLGGGEPTCIALSCETGYMLSATSPQICVPITGPSDCSQCANVTHCAGIMPGSDCLEVDGHSACVRDCSSPGDCPFGYDCVSGSCLPTTGSCTCIEPSHDGLVRLCEQSNQWGTCYGSQTCDISQSPGWGLCNALVPAQEVCGNGVDDDCNGVADDC